MHFKMNAIILNPDEVQGMISLNSNEGKLYIGTFVHYYA